MALVKCQECAADISESAKVCPNCGYSKKKKRTWPLILLAAVVIFVVYAVANGPSNSKEHFEQVKERCIKNRGFGKWNELTGGTLDSFCSVYAYQEIK